MRCVTCASITSIAIAIVWVGVCGASFVSMALTTPTAAATPPAAKPPAATTPPPVGPAATAAAQAPCTCATAELTNGWCERHKVGYVASVKMKSKLLFETLDAHGHTLDLTTFTCPTCRKAIETNGYCEIDKIGFVGKQAYFSRLTYEQAKGRKIDPSRLACRVCRKNARGHGWCYKDKVGIVENVAIDDWQAWQRIDKAIGIVELASKRADQCEHCAVAMVTDSTCPYCRITYKDGKALRPGTAAGPPVTAAK